MSPAALQTHVHGLGTLPCSVPTLTQGSASALGCRRQHSATGNAEQNCLHTNSPCGWQGCGVPRQQPCMGLPPIASSPSSASQPSTELLLCHCAWQKGAQGACSLRVSAAPAQAAQFLFPFSQHPYVQLRALWNAGVLGNRWQRWAGQPVRNMGSRDAMCAPLSSSEPWAARVHPPRASPPQPGPAWASVCPHRGRDKPRPGTEAGCKRCQAIASRGPCHSLPGN